MRCIVLLTILCTFSVFAQSEILPNTLEKIPLKAERFVGIDNYGDLYYIKNRTLFKQSKTETFQFKDFQLGAVGSVDLLNPLKITVFFPDYQTAVLLDNKLNEVKRISFAMEPPFLNIKNATTANDNRLWTFNEDNQQLELFNYRENTNQQLSRPLAEKYNTHKSNFNFCYLLTDKNLRLYNIYGSLLSSTTADGIQKMALSNDKLVVMRNNSLYLLTENLSKETLIKTTDLPIKDLYLSDEFLYIYDGEMIHKMKLTQTKK
ncbi:MAG: hypothetical protein WDZ45_10690 [Flavobacteriaceae bacterium]